MLACADSTVYVLLHSVALQLLCTSPSSLLTFLRFACAASLCSLAPASALVLCRARPGTTSYVRSSLSLCAVYPEFWGVSCAPTPRAGGPNAMVVPSFKGHPFDVMQCNKTVEGE